MRELVFRVDAVELALLRCDPPKLEICARGLVRGGGYTNAQLVENVYRSPPDDGIWEYDFVAEAPRRPSTYRFEAVEANTVLSIPDGLKGIRVRSETRSLAELL